MGVRAGKVCVCDSLVWFLKRFCCSLQRVLISGINLHAELGVWYFGPSTVSGRCMYLAKPSIEHHFGALDFFVRWIKKGLKKPPPDLVTSHLHAPFRPANSNISPRWDKFAPCWIVFSIQRWTTWCISCRILYWQILLHEHLVIDTTEWNPNIWQKTFGFPRIPRHDVQKPWFLGKIRCYWWKGFISRKLCL